MLRTRSDLTDAIEDFITASYHAGKLDEDIASDIADLLYDYNKNLYREIQVSMLPMVKEFEGSKSLNKVDIVKDWSTLAEEWEKLQMWKVMNK